MTDASNIPSNIEEFSRKAEEIYNRALPDIVGENDGKYIAIEIKSGDFFIGETKEAAIEVAKKKYPDSIVFVRRIGNIEKISRHDPLSFSPFPYASVL